MVSAKMPSSAQLASFDMTHGEHAGPKQRKLTDMYNDLQEMKEAPGSEEWGKTLASAKELLSDFVSTECRDHPNPRLAAAFMQGGLEFVLDNYAGALPHDQDAWTAAHDRDPAEAHPDLAPQWQALAAANMATTYRALGDTRRAVEWSQKAVQILPENPQHHLCHALCLAADGAAQRADQILRILADVPNYTYTEGGNLDRLAAAFRYERELHELDLPAARLIIQRLTAGGWFR